ncbi:MAG: hypothetical protein V4622_13245 [Bacteroidota bacterium]
MFCFNACLEKIDTEDNKYFLDHMKWVKLNQNYTYISDSKDTFSFEVLEIQADSGSGGQSVGAPDFYSNKVYFYKTSINTEERNEFINYHIDSRGYVELYINFFESQFDLINSKSKRLKKYWYRNKNLEDVIQPIQHDTVGSNLTNLWWSKSCGILKFTTIDGKTWNKI